MKSMVEITFEGPCPGHAEEILASLGSAGEGRSGAPATAHMRSCARCAAFGESLRVERALLRERSTWGPSPADRGAEPRNGIDRWLVDRFQLRSDIELARALTAVARAVMRQQDDYASRVVSTSGKDDVADVGASMEQLGAIVAQAPSGGDNRTETGRRTERMRSKVQEIAGIVQRLDPARPPEHIAREIATSASEVSPRCASAWILLGNIAWFFGPDRDVLPNFERARETAATAEETALALLNEAILAVDSGDAGSALYLSDASQQAAPTILNRVNRMIWCRVFGMDTAAERLLRSLVVDHASVAAARLLRPSAVHRQMDSLARVFDLRGARKDRITRILIASSAMLCSEAIRDTSSKEDA